MLGDHPGHTRGRNGRTHAHVACDRAAARGLADEAKLAPVGRPLVNVVQVLRRHLPALSQVAPLNNAHGHDLIETIGPRIGDYSLHIIAAIKARGAEKATLALAEATFTNEQRNVRDGRLGETG